MTSQPIDFKDYEDAWSSAQGELLEALLQSEEDCYPWNPAEPEAEAYFAELEQGFFLSDWQEEEAIKSASQALFNQLQQCWSSPASSVADPLNRSLSQRFADFMPPDWLDAIAHKARQVFSTNLSLADQLILCVQPLLPNWTEEDLLVLARPWAYAMRGTSEPALGDSLGVTQSVEWTELAPMEQVRLSLAAAHSALVQLKSDPDYSD